MRYENSKDTIKQVSEDLEYAHIRIEELETTVTTLQEKIENSPARRNTDMSNLNLGYQEAVMDDATM